MSKSVPAPVNPDLLVWAREEGGYDIGEVAAKLSLPPERLVRWESGSEAPTLRQAEKLAALYHRPLPLLFLSERPASQPPGAEFRYLPGVTPGEESPELRLALRMLRRRRDIALDLLDEMEELPEPFSLSARLDQEPEEVGARLREALGVTVDQQYGWRDPYESWRTWRDRTESLGLMVFQVPGLDLREMRGVALFQNPLPVVGVNSKDHPLARPFTLMHEVVHLMLRAGGEESAAKEQVRHPRSWPLIERFADSVAAATLMPGDAFTHDPDVATHPPGAAWSINEIEPVAKRFRVSMVAAMTRLATLSRMSWEHCRNLRAVWERKFERQAKRKTGGGPTRAGLILSRVGPSYAALVLDSLTRDLITPLAASDALDLKVHHFDRLKSALLHGAEPPPTPSSFAP